MQNAGILNLIEKGKLKIAAVGDLHFRGKAGSLRPFFEDLGDLADVLLLCGDLTDYGTEEEAQELAKELSGAVKVPMVGVLGNHDYESGRQDEVRKILMNSGITILDGESHEVGGVGFAGIKGFLGGFGRYTLGAWGEDTIKTIVRETINEALKLESALARLKSENRIVLMHYSPVQATVDGEPEEIYPFLGSSRLEEPLLRHPITAVFHGHAHKGTLEGKLLSGAPVYNVALPLLAARFPTKPPFKVLELPLGQGGDSPLIQGANL